LPIRWPSIKVRDNQRIPPLYSYWIGADIWGMHASPTPLYAEMKKEFAEADPETVNPHLRSAGEVINYHIQAQDGEIGHVEDFIVDDLYWIIRYMVVDTRNWLPGRKVIVSPKWIQSVNWMNRQVTVSFSVDAVKESPPYDPSIPINRNYELQLFDFYGRPKYW
jgi:hypothetical protein